MWWPRPEQPVFSNVYSEGQRWKALVPALGTQVGFTEVPNEKCVGTFFNQP